MCSGKTEMADLPQVNVLWSSCSCTPVCDADTCVRSSGVERRGGEGSGVEWSGVGCMGWGRVEWGGECSLLAWTCAQIPLSIYVNHLLDVGNTGHLSRSDDRWHPPRTSNVSSLHT